MVESSIEEIKNEEIKKNGILKNLVREKVSGNFSNGFLKVMPDLLIICN